MIDLSVAPPAVHRLVGWLGSESFETLERQSADRFNQLVVLGQQDRRVQITATRGDWSLGVGLATMAETFHPDVWEAWIERVDLVADLSDLDHQVVFITSRWAEAVASARVHRAVERELRAIDVDYVRRWLDGPHG